MKNEIFGMDDDFDQNVDAEELQSARQTVFHILFDESGSMSPYETIMPKCISFYQDTLLKSKQEDEILVAITRFSSDVKLGKYKFVKDISNAYSTGGCTALYQAIVEASEHLINPNGTGYMDTLRAKGVSTKAVFIVFSDGEDYGVSKSEGMLSEAKKQIAYLNSKEVTTAFVEFGNDARGIAEDLGFNNILSTDATESELRNIFAILSKSSISASKSAGATSQNAFFV